MKQYINFISRSCGRFIVILTCSSPAFADNSVTNDQVRQLMIHQSIERYSGACPCPYSSARNGSVCGGRSAYTKPGGYSTLCYPKDIADSEFNVWRSANGISKDPTNQAKKSASTARPSTDNVLPQGSFSGIYKRQDWRHWIDEDHDCQNTRDELLIAQSLDKPKLDTKGCNVLSGTWNDPYSGIQFRDSSKLDIDHLVPLKWANGHGGSFWPKNQKQLFANDPSNLRAVDSHLNRQKSDKGPDEWMPPRQQFRCEYAREFTGIVNKYDLAWTPSEKRIVDRMLEACNH